MRILNSVQELWSQCSYCPICRDYTRTVDIQHAQVDANVVHWRKIDNILKIRCNLEAIRKPRKTISYVINCSDNSFEFLYTDDTINKTYKYGHKLDDVGYADDMGRTKPISKAPNINCHLIGSCGVCLNTFSTGSFFLNAETSKIEDIRLEKDSVYIINAEGNYHVTQLHYCDSMLISKCNIAHDGAIDDGEVSEFPMVELDFSRPARVLNKVKTLLLFS